MPDALTSRERVTAAIEFTGPDRVPFTHVCFPGALWRHGRRVVDLMERHPDDFGHGSIAIPPEPGDRIEEYRDEWGVLWHRLKGYSAGEVKRPALETWDDYPSYELPTVPRDLPFDDWYLARMRDPEREWYALDGWADVFERLKMIRGAENLLIDLAEDREELHDLTERLVERNMRWIEHYISAGGDGIFLADDWGSQDRLLISPTQWRAVFRPQYKRMFELVRDAGKHVFFHSCGWTLDIWDDLIELGASVLNIQHALVPRPILEEKLVGRVCVFSDPDRQRIMPFGTPEDVREHIREIVDTFALPTGGLIHRGELAPDWTFENIEAMYEAFDEFTGPPAER